VDAEHVNKMFDFLCPFFKSFSVARFVVASFSVASFSVASFLEHVEQTFPNVVVDNIALLNNDVLIELNEINHAPNIRFVQILNSVDILVANIQILLLANVANKFANLGFRQLVEPDTDKLVLQ
jgi:hypothetical protein